MEHNPNKTESTQVLLKPEHLSAGLQLFAAQDLLNTQANYLYTGIRWGSPQGQLEAEQPVHFLPYLTKIVTRGSSVTQQNVFFESV